MQVLPAELSWYHHITLLDKISDREIRLFYIVKTIKNGWSRNVSVHQIERELQSQKIVLLSEYIGNCGILMKHIEHKHD